MEPSSDAFKKEAEKEKEKSKKIPLKELRREREMEVRIHGENVRYRVVAEAKNLRNEFDEPILGIFTISYTRLGVDSTKRPLVFVFNGGPGSCSAWLHFGAFGPKRVVLDDNGFPSAPPYTLTENEFSLLDKADFVFVDPTGTGFSRASSEEERKKVCNTQKDVESVGEVIRQHVSKEGRWLSPLYLAGESYGTTRAASLVNWLQTRHGMYFSGVILISCVLDFQTIIETPGHDLARILMFPSYVATSHFHKKLTPSLQSKSLVELVKEAELFAAGEYSAALFKGDDLAGAEKETLARKLADYTGLPLEKIQRWNLRISLENFTRTLFEKEKKGVGRLDSRYLGDEPEYLTDPKEYRDPSLFALQGPYSACANHYLRAELGFDSDLPYELLSDEVNKDWSYDAHNSYLDVSVKLKAAMLQNPNLKVYVGSGYYDFATPYFAALYNFKHLELPKDFSKSFQFDFYESGHMMYVHKPSLKKFRDDLIRFLGA